MDWWAGWFAISAYKPLDNASWMLQRATDLPLLSRPGDVDNGLTSTLQHSVERPWLPSNPDGHDPCNRRLMLYINPRSWCYRIQTTSIFNKLDPCKTHPCHRCELQRALCYIAGSIMKPGSAQCIGEDDVGTVIQDVPVCPLTPALSRGPWTVVALHGTG